MRRGFDNRLYVAQAFGSQITAIDLGTGASTVVSAVNGAIVAPDDLAFDSKGNLYATEVMSERVSVRRPNGQVEVVAANVPVANGITIHDDHIFLSEFRPDGRILELSSAGASPRVIADGLACPNALSLAPDGFLYFPLVPLGEVWRVSPAGGRPEKFAEGFALPTAVKVSPDGTLFVVEAQTGSVTCIDLRSGRRSRFADVGFGIDNLEFGEDDELFISHFTDGSVLGVRADGRIRVVADGGVLGPFGMAATGNGGLAIADGLSIGMLRPNGQIDRPAMIMSEGFPGFVRGLHPGLGGALLCTTTSGTVCRYTFGEAPVILATGLQQPTGVCALNGDEVVVCESGAGRVIGISDANALRVIAEGLDRPVGVHVCGDGTIVISEAGAGRVLSLAPDGHPHALMEGLVEPHGVAGYGNDIFVLDRGAGEVLCFDRTSLETTKIAWNFCTDAWLQGRRNVLPGISHENMLPGPLTPFADVVVLSNGRLCVGCDNDGSIWSLSRNDNWT